MPADAHRGPQSDDQPDRDDHIQDYLGNPIQAVSGPPDQREWTGQQDGPYQHIMPGIYSGPTSRDPQEQDKETDGTQWAKRAERAEQAIVTARWMFRREANPQDIRGVLCRIPIDEGQYPEVAS